MAYPHCIECPDDGAPCAMHGCMNDGCVIQRAHQADIDFERDLISAGMDADEAAEYVRQHSATAQ